MKSIEEGRKEGNLMHVSELSVCMPQAYSWILHFFNFLLLIFLYSLWQFGIKSAVLNAELPQNSRLHILEVC